MVCLYNDENDPVELGGGFWILFSLFLDVFHIKFRMIMSSSHKEPC